MILAGCVAIVVRPQLPLDADRHGLGGWIAENLHSSPGIPFRSLMARWDPPLEWSEYRAIVDEPAGLKDYGELSGIGTLEKQIASLGAHNFCLVACGYHLARVGWWAPATHIRIAEMEIANYGNADGRLMEGGPNAYPWNFEEVRRLYWKGAARKGKVPVPPEVSRALTAGMKWSGSALVSSGHLINGATLLGLGMWLWFTPFVIRDLRRWRRARRGGCAKCAYDLRGLTGTVCPECGTESFIPST